MRTGSRRVALGLLAMLYGLALFAGFFAPYSYREQHRSTPRAAPSRVSLRGPNGRLGLRPHVEVESTRVPLRWLVRGARYRALGVFESDLHFLGVDAPHKVFLLGTDRLGRDIFSRLLYGAQLSLFAGLFAGLASIALALLLGGLAGYAGGPVDGAIQWVGDVLMSLPWLYMLLAARAFLPLDVPAGVAFLTIIATLGLLGWVGPMRIARAIVASARSRDFVVAARSAGASHARVLALHLLPQTRRAMSTQFAMLVPGFVLAEVTLSFVGLGMAPPRPSLGTLLAELARGSTVDTPWLIAPTALLVLVTWLYHRVSGPGGDGDGFVRG